jgi:hypothetical protein
MSRMSKLTHILCGGTQVTLRTHCRGLARFERYVWDRHSAVTGAIVGARRPGQLRGFGRAIRGWRDEVVLAPFPHRSSGGDL